MASPLTTGAFGGDLDLATGDITYNGRGQPNYCTGADLLSQAIYRRLITPLGRLLLHPDYGGGLKQYIDQPMTPTLVAQLQNVVTTQVLKDPRIASVQSVTVTLFTQGTPGFQLDILVVPTTSPNVLALSIPIKAST